MDPPDPSTRAYEVGRGKPPQEHRFKAGQPSANPHGRRGKPENRERIAADKAAKRARNTAAATLRRAAERLRRVTTSDGATKTMTTLDVVAERISGAAANGDVRLGLKLLSMLHDHDRQPVRPLTPEPEPTVGPMVIGVTCNTMEETLKQLQMEEETRQLQLQLAELTGDVAAACVVRTGGPLPQTSPDRRETHAYGQGVAVGPSRTPSPSPPTPGRSLKADGRYR